jgi:hypothetical protein
MIAVAHKSHRSDDGKTRNGQQVVVAAVQEYSITRSLVDREFVTAPRKHFGDDVHELPRGSSGGKSHAYSAARVVHIKDQMGGIGTLIRNGSAVGNREGGENVLQSACGPGRTGRTLGALGARSPIRSGRPRVALRALRSLISGWARARRPYRSARPGGAVRTHRTGLPVRAG